MPPSSAPSASGRPAANSYDDPRMITGAISYDKAIQAALSDTGVKGLKEVYDYTFYDSVTLATATSQRSTLFQAIGTDPQTSNFQGTGYMPSGQAFLITGLRVAFQIGTTLADTIALMKGVSLELTLESSKKYCQGLLQQFPAGIGATCESFSGITTPTAGLSLGNNGIPALANAYRFKRPVVLHSQQPFQVVLQSYSPTLANTTRMFVYLDGVAVRNVI